MDKPTPYIEVFHLETVSINPDNINKFIEKLGAIVTGPMIEKEDAFIITVDPAIFMNFSELRRVRSKLVKPLVERLSLQPFFSLYCGEPYGFEIRKTSKKFVQKIANTSFQVESDTCHGNIEPASLSTDPQEVEKLRHVNRLKVAFNNINQEEIAESVKFLIEKCGWTTKDFQNTTPKPISPITIYRYKNGKFKQQYKKPVAS